MDELMEALGIIAAVMFTLFIIGLMIVLLIVPILAFFGVHIRRPW